MNKSIEFINNKMTKLKCPHCNIGCLAIKDDLLHTKQYKYNDKDIEEKYLGQCFCIDDYLGVIGGLLQCSQCNDYVSFVGEITGEKEYLTDRNGQDCDKDVSYLNFKYINPPIKLIEVHKEYPNVIQKLLEESFSLFWNHEGSCLNKLRIVVEEVLNDLSIPKKAKIRNGRNAGKFRNLTAHARIEKLKEKAKYEDVADYLLALKWIGNDGSHSPVEIGLEVLKDTYEILHKALDLIYLKTDERLKKRVSEINKKKGL